VKAVLKALHEASVWLDDMGNRPEQCDIVSKLFGRVSVRL
jgi:nitrate/nitrite transport system substrate-binding protein